jgi:phytoene synthase
MWTVDSVGFEGQSLEDDLKACRETIRIGSRSFYAASRLLPKQVRNAAFALYAFCRVSDDAVDLGQDQRLALNLLQNRLDKVYKGTPEARPVDRAFAWVVRTYGIPREVPEALLDGYRWDISGRRYRELDELIGYAVRVASTVGVMMALVMGVRERTALARACDLGIAMQLTNIARDIGEDARAGRLYVPTDWIAASGENPLQVGQATSGTARVTRRLLEAADQFYERGIAGIVYLPSSCQSAIMAAARIYQRIGVEIARNGFDSISRRAVVSSRRKLALLGVAQIQASRIIDDLDAAPHQEAVFLLNAVETTTKPILALEDAPSKSAWVIDLIGRLEARDRSLNYRSSI